MLQWFAGAKVQDVEDVDATEYIEPPETPAPVFAVRAFKHAIFGTPATVQPKPRALRRHSNTENGKARPNARPAMARPKSSGDTHTLAAYDGVNVEPMPMPSPTKGILMTPGTAAARRKTVSFGAHVQDNEGKRQGKSGLPDSCPGKFPSPFVKSSAAEDSEIDVTDKARGRNKLTEKLEQVRDDSVKRRSISTRHSVEPGQETAVASDFAGPDAQLFKVQFEEYKERSERECRKLVAKQRAAKSFAREKDVQLMETADQLRQEKKNVDRLEKQVSELQAQLKEYQEKLRASEAAEQSAKEEVVRLKRGSGLTGYRRHGDFPTTASSRTHHIPDRQERESVLKTRTSRECLLSKDTKPTAAGESEDATARPRARLRHQSRREHDDVWAPSLAESSLIPTKPDVLPPGSSTRAGRTSTNDAPLKSLNLNTLPQESLALATSMGMQPPSPQREARQDSPMRSPITRSRPTPSGSLSIVVPDSSPFLPDSENERPNILTGTPVPIRSPIRAKASAAKENASPTPKAPRRPIHENLDPKNVARVVGAPRSDMEEALEVARLNLANRGRKVS